MGECDFFWSIRPYESDWWPLLWRSSVLTGAGEEWLLRDCLPVCQLAYGALHVFSGAWNSWRTGGGVKGQQPPLMQPYSSSHFLHTGQVLTKVSEISWNRFGSHITSATKKHVLSLSKWLEQLVTLSLLRSTTFSSLQRSGSALWPVQGSKFKVHSTCRITYAHLTLGAVGYSQTDEGKVITFSCIPFNGLLYCQW